MTVRGCRYGWGRKGVSAASLKLWLDEIRKGFGLEFWCRRSREKLIVWRSVDGQAGDLGERTPAMEVER